MSAAGLGTDPSAATTPARVPASLREAATDLANLAIAALPAWVERCVAEVSEPHGPAVATGLRAPARAAGSRCAAETGPALREMLFTDARKLGRMVDRSTPRRSASCATPSDFLPKCFEPAASPLPAATNSRHPAFLTIPTA